MITKITTLLTLLLSLQLTAQINSKELKQADYKNSLQYIWDNKQVINSKIIDNAESLEGWDFGSQAKVELSNSIIKNGKSSIKMTAPAEYNDGQEYPIAYVEKLMNGANIEQYNRIAVWVYAEHKNAGFFYLSLEFKNAGKTKIPDRFGRIGKHYAKLETNRWNRVYWEIPSMPRDKVKSIAFVYTIKGKQFEGVGNDISVYIDDLELQKIDADKDDGWKVQNGKIAYSHNGYLPNSIKTAIVNDVGAKQFSVINIENNKEAINKDIQIQSTRFGDFQILDFSEINQPGKYKIKVGDIESGLFNISKNIWEQSVWNNINFWRSERCGQTVDGIHGNCHADVYCEHNGKKIIVNGGWHDAGDLTQMIYNTGDAIVAMLELAEKVENTNPEMYNALVDEAKWGLDWMLKTRFGDGFRHYFGGISKYTDGVIGTNDDISFKAENLPYENFLSSMVLSEAALFFEGKNNVLAERCKTAAVDDWKFATEKADILNVELCGNATIASANIYKLTDDNKYKEKAIEWAKIITQSQQKEKTDWDVPLAGFFFKSPKHEQILRYNPIGMDQAPIIALKELAELFPDNKNWMDWYSTIALYGEYIKETSKLANPFQMIPQSVYNVDEVHKPSVHGFQQSTLAKYKKYEEEEPIYRQQVENGMPLGKGNYLKTFPVWYSHRGSAGILLSQAKGLSVASSLRSDNEGKDLAQLQLQWLVGRNPFAQSNVYGEGYDFPPMYFASSGPLVGALACGIQTHGNSDLPNWPAAACYNYKEIWSHTTARYLWLISDFIKSEKQTEDNNIEFSVSTKQLGKGKYKVTVSAEGEGDAEFELRTWNLEVKQSVEKVQLEKGETKNISWTVKRISSNQDIVAVVTINGKSMAMKEVNFYSKK
ncbi:MAG: glycoside hydrolase family 9 protein [Bacteroidota bacterium]